MSKSHLPGGIARSGVRSWRSRLFRGWLACALPWLALVAAASVYDHHRAIGRTAAAAAATAISQDGPAVESLSSQAAVWHIVYALRWLEATIDYCGGSIATYGFLPGLLTLFLFVLFLPWADQWSRRGSIED